MLGVAILWNGIEKFFVEIAEEVEAEAEEEEWNERKVAATATIILFSIKKYKMGKDGYIRLM